MALTRHLLLFDIDGSTVSAGDLVLVVDLPPATQGVAYAGLLSATGGVAPYTFSETGTLPAGLSLDATTGELTGTPTALGYFEFTATVTDSGPTVKSKVVAIKVSSTIIVGGVLPPGEVGIAYSSGLSASGGTPPFTWSLLSGSLPGGLGPINSSTGIIAGTPTTPGVYNFTIRATDSASSTQDFPTSITVYAAVDLSTSTFPAGIVGVPYNAGPTTIGGVAPFTYSISSGAIPAGCTFSTTSGFVSGQPTTAATYTFHVTVLDTLGGTSTYNASVAITAGGGGGSGTVTSVSSGNLSPLFNVTVGTPTTTPAFAFSQIAQAANLVFKGPNSGGSANPTFAALVNADIPSSGVTAATYGDSSHVAQVALNSKGVATSASNVLITPVAIGAAAFCQIITQDTPGTYTYTKPANAVLVRVRMLGGGGGGGGGASIASNRFGGGGGGGGAYEEIWLPASLLGSTVSYTVAATTAGATPVTSGTGNNGTVGNPTSFGSFGTAYGGGPGRGGNGSNFPTAGSGGGQGGPGNLSPGTSGTVAVAGILGGQTGNITGTAAPEQIGVGGASGGAGQSLLGGSAGSNATWGGPGGGAGAGGDAATGQVGGVGGIAPYAQTAGTSGAGQTGGATNASNGGNGSAPSTGWGAGSGGGGGGSVAGAGATGKGGNGGNGSFGAGGGGGGHTHSGLVNGGGGGDGGGGRIEITTWF